MHLKVKNRLFARARSGRIGGRLRFRNFSEAYLREVACPKTQESFDVLMKASILPQVSRRTAEVCFRSFAREIRGVMVAPPVSLYLGSCRLM